MVKGDEWEDPEWKCTSPVRRHRGRYFNAPLVYCHSLDKRPKQWILKPNTVRDLTMNLNVNWQCCSRHDKPHSPLIKHNRQLQGSNSPLFGTCETAFAHCVWFETPHCNKGHQYVEAPSGEDIGFSGCTRRDRKNLICSTWRGLVKEEKKNTIVFDWSNGEECPGQMVRYLKIFFEILETF